MSADAERNPVNESKADEEAKNKNFRTKLFENINNKCFKNQGVSIVEKLAEKCSPVKRPFSAANGESSVPKAKKYKRGL